MTPVVVLAILILLNGILAISETAVVSSRKSRLKNRAQDGDKSARAAYKLAKNPMRFLSATQIGLTFISIMLGAVASTQLAGKVAAWLKPLPYIGRYNESLGLALLVLVLTYFTVVIGELLPKRIGVMHPEAVATAIARPMRWLTHLASPLVKLFSVSANVLLRLLSITPPANDPVTPDELKVLIQEGADAGIFDKTERDIMTNVFRLAERRTSAIMTPRTDIAYLDANDPPDVIRAKILEEPHAFYPIVETHLDHVMGVLSAKDIMARVLAGEDIEPTTLMHRALIVPESISILQMLDSFRQNPAQIAFIADEYGSILGIVTQNSVVEAIVGEMPTLEERHEPDMVMRDDGSWLVNGTMAADDLSEKLRLPEMPERNHFDSVGGFALIQLQRIPNVGDKFQWANTTFEVVDMDGKRIDKLLVTPPQRSMAADEQD